MSPPVFVALSDRKVIFLQASVYLSMTGGGYPSLWSQVPFLASGLKSFLRGWIIPVLSLVLLGRIPVLSLVLPGEDRTGITHPQTRAGEQVVLCCGRNASSGHTGGLSTFYCWIFEKTVQHICSNQHLHYVKLVSEKDNQCLLLFFRGCKNNNPAWDVLKLSYRLNLTDITNYTKGINVSHGFI